MMFGPNISGEIPSGGVWSAAEPTGCFFRGSNRQISFDGGGDGGVPIFFDASRSDPIYGVSTTVQPSSLLGLACIKF